MGRPYYIIEVANTHGGDFQYLTELIDSVADLKEGIGMKFQAFHPDCIATSNYSFYETYKKLHFTQAQWKQLIDRAKNTKDVWLDIFDSYGVEALKENLDIIHGIKFQSSVLYNFEVFKALENIDLTGKKIILNVAAQPIDSIKDVIERVEQRLRPEEILLEFGYQAYPTTLEDSGFCKLKIIKKNFSNRIVFADHVDGKTDDAIWLPVVASMFGVDCIEKHVMLDSRETHYDYFSSITPHGFKKMTEQIERYLNMQQMPFINEKEKVYLKKSLMIPILKKSRSAGSGINLEDDFIYRRSGENGLNVQNIEFFQNNFHILSADKKNGETLLREDFKKATIATIVACRLKSTRLPRKALLQIGNLTSVERCIKSCLSFKNVNHTVLATSVLPEDAELEDYTFHSDVIFHKGDPDDVIQRYLDISEKLKIDTIIRVTADCPFLSEEIVSRLLISHFSTGADYTTATKAAVGTNAEIINTTALREVMKHFKRADYSEYMTWYFQNNPDFFSLNFVDLPEYLIRNYRLTLDYQEDLEMFNKLQDHFDKNNLEFDLVKAFEFLDTHPDVSQTNSHLTLRYKTDQKLIDTLNNVTKIHPE